MRKEKREQCFYSQYIVFFLYLLAFIHTLLTNNLLKSRYDMTFMLEQKNIKLKLKISCYW
jgi:hypothetical protein